MELLISWLSIAYAFWRVACVFWPELSWNS